MKQSEFSDKPWHALPAEDALNYWESDLERGLSREQAEDRLERIGQNALPLAPRANLFIRFARQFADPLVGALLAAAVVAFGVAIAEGPLAGDSLTRFGDTIAILLIVILNAVLGFIQERKAEEALNSLQKMAAPSAKVLRDGQVRVLPSRLLVPGDLVELEAGDSVPADVRLVKSAEFATEEAPLTGESVPISKRADVQLEPDTALAERENLAFMGTTVSRGRARALVVHTGTFTEIGRVGVLIRAVKREPTPLELRLARFGTLILLGCLAISGGLFAIGMIRQSGEWSLLLLTSVSLAVAAIPEGLPAITTITLALGMQRMAQRGALIRKLPAVETLGSATVICSDKTGTLTQNAMTVRRIETVDARYKIGGEGHQTTGTLELGDQLLDELDAITQRAVHVGVIDNTAVIRHTKTGVRVIGDPTEAALLTLGRKIGLEREAVLSEATIEHTLPFESARGMMSVVVRYRDGARFEHAKGAVEAILPRCTHVLTQRGKEPLTDETRQAIMERAEHLSSLAYRVLAMAEREDPQGDAETHLTYLGIVALIDPPRPQALSAVKACHEAGIRTAMITGDHKLTAVAIAKELGMWGPHSQAYNGAEIDNMDDQRLISVIDRVSVFARVTAEQKLRIVKLLKQQGHIVAMTGDGVNDAPALREAQIGVAMGHTGTDVAREASEMVIKDDNFATIVEAIKEGRAIYRNIQKSVFFLLSSNAGLVIAVIASSFFHWPQFTPLQLLWINLVTNGLPALALGVDPVQASQMQEPPRPVRAPLLGWGEALGILLIGAVMGFGALGLFFLPQFAPGFFAGLDETQVLERARSMAFAMLGFSPLAHAFNCRSTRVSIFRVGISKNPWLWLAVALSLGIHLVTVLAPPLHPIFKTHLLSAPEWGIVIVLSLLPIPVFELYKLLVRHFRP
ncbi:MAG: cation-transporting P-type ATPase [Myxococcales bacterium]|nr:cation-transporting P-type ATPase [Myxococcales bacterium]